MKKFLISCMLISICSIGSAVYSEEPIDTVGNESNQEVVKEIAQEAIVQTEQASNKKVLKPSDKAKYDNFCEKANKLIDDNKYEQAENIINKALAISSDLDMAYALKARISYKKGSSDADAQKWAQKALNINPNNHIANNIMGNISENIETARNYYEKSLAAKKDYLPPIINLASSYAQNNEHEKSIEYYSKYISIVPKETLKKQDSNEYISRAIQYRLLGKYDLAIKDTNSALLINKNNPYALAEQGYNYALKGNFNEAIKSANKAIKLGENLKDSVFYTKRVCIYKLMNSDFSMVQNDFKTIESLAGNNVDNLYDLVRLYISFSREDDAIRVCKKILTKEPDNQKIMLIYGSALTEMGRSEEALEVFKKICNCKSGLDSLSRKDKANYYYYLGLTKYRMAGLNNISLVKEAINDFNNSYNILPENSNYFIGNGYFINEEYKNAYDSYKKELLRIYSENKNYDFNIVYKLMLLKELAIYDNYNAKTQHWGVPKWISDDIDNDEIPHWDWDDLADSLKDDVAGRINYSNGIPRIDDKNYILSTINMLKSHKGNIGKVYNLHIKNDSFGNTSRVFVYPYIDAADTKAVNINSDDYDLLLANQYFLLLRNSVGSIPHVYSINQTDLNNFFNSLENIPKNIAINLIEDISSYSLGGWDFFEDEEISLSFYQQMISFLENNGLANYSQKTKRNMKIAYIALGDSYLEEDNIELAIMQYNNAIPYGASKFDINEFIGNYYYNNDNYFKANEYYTKALTIKANANVYLSRGQARTKLRDYDGAVADFNKAIGYNKNLAEAYWERGQVLFDQKKYSIALNDYIKYSSMNKDSVAAQYNAGICLYNTGKKQAAVPYLERAKSIAQRVGDQELYNKSVNLINKIKGYNRSWY